MVLNRSLIVTAVAASALFAIGGTAAQAQTTFNFTTLTTPDPVTGANGTSVDLTSPSDQFQSVLGNSTSTIVLTNLINNTTAPITSPDNFTTTLTTAITMTNAGQSIVQNLVTTLTATNSSVTTGTFSSSIDTTQPAPLTFSFANGNVVTLNNFTFTAPGNPGGGFGAIGATANASVVTANAAPEPGSLALLGTSALGVTGMVIRRRRAK